MSASLSDVLRNIRRELYITQEQMARDLDISYSTLNRWENGHHVPSRLARKQLIEYSKQKGITAEIIKSLEQA